MYCRKVGSLAYSFVPKSLGLTSVTVMYLDCKAAKFGEMALNDGSSGSFKVVNIGTNGKSVCNFLCE